MCNHNPNNKETTIKFSSIRTMQKPDVRQGYCIKCGESFKFLFEDGKRIEQ